MTEPKDSPEPPLPSRLRAASAALRIIGAIFLLRFAALPICMGLTAAGLRFSPPSFLAGSVALWDGMMLFWLGKHLAERRNRFWAVGVLALLAIGSAVLAVMAGKASFEAPEIPVTLWASAAIHAAGLAFCLRAARRT